MKSSPNQFRNDLAGVIKGIRTEDGGREDAKAVLESVKKTNKYIIEEAELLRQRGLKKPVTAPEKEETPLLELAEIAILKSEKLQLFLNGPGGLIDSKFGTTKGSTTAVYDVSKEKLLELDHMALVTAEINRALDFHPQHYMSMRKVSFARGWGGLFLI